MISIKKIRKILSISTAFIVSMSLMGNLNVVKAETNQETITLSTSNSSTKVVGYFTDWTNMDINRIQYDKLTHINYAFLIPETNGDVKPIVQEAKMKELITKAHENNVKVLISVGGWEYHGAVLDPVFATAASNDISREKLVNNIVDFVNKYNFDGADIDWEYPDPGTESDNFLKLMTSLNAKLKPQGKLLTAAVTSGTAVNSPTESWTAKGVTKEIFPLVDFLNIMAYDGGNGADHSPYIYAENAMKVWTQKGLPKEKMVLGLPFYARPSWRGYNEIVASDPQAPFKDRSGIDYYNGIDTIKKKTQLGLNLGSGVMIWELSQDTNDSTSLLKAINDVTGDVHGPVVYAPEDVNQDGKIDINDLSLLGLEYNKNSIATGFDEKFDVNKDKIIDVYDLVMVAKKLPAKDDGGGEESEGETTWNKDKVYVGGDEVLYNGIKYRAKWWTQGDTPGTNEVWEKIG